MRYPVNEKVSECVPSNLHGFRLGQMSVAQAANGSVDLRGAYSELLTQFRIASAAAFKAQLESNDDILWFGKH